MAHQCCPHCRRTYQTPLDLPPVVITSVTEVQDEMAGREIQRFRDYSSRTLEIVKRLVSLPDYDRVLDLIRNTASGTGRVDVTLAYGDEPGVVQVKDERPDSLDYTISIQRNLSEIYAAEIKRAKSYCMFHADDTPVHIAALFADTERFTEGDPSARGQPFRRFHFYDWPDASLHLCIGWLQLSEDQSHGTFQARLQKNGFGDVFNLGTLWDVSFTL